MTLLQTQTLEIQVYISRISNFFRALNWSKYDYCLKITISKVPISILYPSLTLKPLCSSQWNTPIYQVWLLYNQHKLKLRIEKATPPGSLFPQWEKIKVFTFFSNSFGFSCLIMHHFYIYFLIQKCCSYYHWIITYLWC